MYCCAGCFDDIFLSDHIKKSSSQTGNCSYCDSKNVPIIEPIKLQDRFEVVAAAYEISVAKDAKLLAQWLRADWSIFTALNDEMASRLLGHILDDADITLKLVEPLRVTGESSVVKWGEFRKEIIERNRFFLRHEIDLENLRFLFQRLEANREEVGETLYRARIQNGDVELELKDLGLTPAAAAKSGRANPVGIPYLYAASTPETAIAEVRPHPGDKVAVASMLVDQSVRLVNLRYPKRTVSPFMTLDETEVPEFRYQMEFLSHLESELAKPVLPRVADLEYLPTQYLCEFVKNCGYDGLIFRSSISDGVNVTLFNDDKVKYGEIDHYEVTRLSYSQNRLR